MKKFGKLIAIALSASMLVGAAGCFRSTDDGPKVDTGKVQLLVGNFNGGYGSEWLNKAVKRFEAKYADYDFGNGKKGVKVWVNNDARYSGSMETNMQAYPQHVILAENVNYYNMVDISDGSSKYIVDMSDVVNTPINKDFITGQTDTSYGAGNTTIADIMNSSMKEYLNVDGNGKYYGVPFYEATVGIVYDVDVFEKYGFYYAAEGYGDSDGFIQDTNGNWIGQNGKVIGNVSSMTYAQAIDAGVKLGNGPDGAPDTYDDGCPATYADFFKMCLRMYTRGVTPLTWPGDEQIQRYLNYLAYNLWTDYEGSQMGLNFSLNGTATDLIKMNSYNSATGAYETETVNITDANGYELQRQAGKFEAVNFIYNLVKDSRYYDTTTCFSSTSQKEAERAYILSALPTKQDRAMLIDGSWWQNEAGQMFYDMAVDFDNDAYLAKNRRFGMLPLPKANQSKVGQGNSLAFNTATVIVINKKSTTDATTLKVAKQFVKFLHTHESLYEFTATTSSARPYTYTLNDTELNALTSVAKQNYELHSSTDFIFTYSKQAIVRKNPERFSCSGYLVFQAYGGLEEILSRRFHNVKSTTGWDYFKSMVDEHGKDFWNSNFANDIKK